MRRMVLESDVVKRATREIIRLTLSTEAFHFDRVVESLLKE